MVRDEKTLRAAYAAFNSRDVEAAIALMHPQVDWPNAWEGGRVIGHAAVRDYWTRQFKEISAQVDPEQFTEEPDGAIAVRVHQVIHDANSGILLSDDHVIQRYLLVGELIARMDVEEADG